MKELKFSKEIEVRFSEVDSMGVVWHGNYPLYLEDAREAWGHAFGLGYQDYIDHNILAPIVELNLQYKKPIRYGMRPRIDIIYRPTTAAKVIFDYEIHDSADDSLLTTGHSVQVFMDQQFQLLWQNPDFYETWKQRWEQV